MISLKTLVTIEILKEFLDALKKNRIKYIVIAGFGIDGKRGFLARPHQDLDVLCLKSDLPKIEKMIHSLKYSGKRYNDLYKLIRDDGSKIDLALVTKEGDEAVTYGRIAITRLPFMLFENLQKGNIDGFEFNIAPNELLKTWGKDAPKGEDVNYVEALPADPGLIKRITRILRKDL